LTASIYFGKLKQLY